MISTVRIDYLPESVQHYNRGYAVVVVDVFRATTSAITAVVLGHRCFPVASLPEAQNLAMRLSDPILAGEQNGFRPDGFHINNSPYEIANLEPLKRPIILLSSSGTRLCRYAGECQEAYVACLRNYDAAARHLAQQRSKVVIIGAGTRGEFREEDQLCCAWLCERLLALGYEPEDNATMEYVLRWQNAQLAELRGGRSAEYLRRTGQEHDLEFVLNNVNDVEYAFPLTNGEIGLISHVPRN